MVVLSEVIRMSFVSCSGFGMFLYLEEVGLLTFCSARSDGISSMLPRMTCRCGHLRFVSTSLNIPTKRDPVLQPLLPSICTIVQDVGKHAVASFDQKCCVNSQLSPSTAPLASLLTSA